MKSLDQILSEILQALEGAEERAKMSLEEYNSAFPESPEGLGMLIEFGQVEFPPYNGMIGDSCRCCVCNLRRLVEGPDQNYDREHNVELSDAIEAVKVGYAPGEPPMSTKYARAVDLMARFAAGQVKH